MKLSAESTFTAATGMKLPVIGLGTYQAFDEAALTSALHNALELGYRLIDTAFTYQNEHVIGKVLREWFDSGRLQREDIFITTKLPPTGNRPEHVHHFLEQQLKALQLDYVDLYLIHHPVGWKYGQQISHTEGDTDNSHMQVDPTTDHVALWKEMEKMVDARLTKYIGLSNFNTKQIGRVLQHARFPPSNLQIELHVYCQSKEELEFCKKHGITLTSYATLGSFGVPSGLLNGSTDNPLQDPVVQRIASTHGKTPAQVLLRHALQLGAALIPKSTSPVRLQQNIDIFDFELTEDEMVQLSELDKGEDGKRFIVTFMEPHPEYPYKRRTHHLK